MSWFKGLFKSKDEKFEEEYPFLILSPRVPMEEELGISKEEVLLNYNKIVLGDLCDELKKLGFKQRGKTQEYYKILKYNVVATISIHRNMKSFSIFNVNCGFTCLCVELDRWHWQYGNSLTRYMGLPPYDFDVKDEYIAKQSCQWILKVVQNKFIPLADSLSDFEESIKLLGRITSFGCWDTALCLYLREGKLERARKEIMNIKNNTFLNGCSVEDAYNEYVKDKLEYYETLVSNGADACIQSMLEREEKNKKKYKIK